MNFFIHKLSNNLEYKVSKPLLYFTCFILLVVAFSGLYINNFSLEPKFYIECNNIGGCVNMFYNSPDCVNSPYEYTGICTEKFIPYGSSIGYKPDFIIRNLFLITLFIVGGFFLINTLLYNKGFLGKLKLGDRFE